ncbi:hypothetical protein K491DRAFT_682949 [Lophiostoma macrostomum CBS 122681]|uniref:Uncharacterized protein n=1 Tax=Lophiostoma macrostomum CBS 122681 TaxID=1314788 RepID=A0A6A6SV56_9PLEO|nr:hypothetical protein K491DRAFT_682949 [Lophiostoma macrostomum CBS 122681]
MSDLTPPSFFDDGLEFNAHPPGRRSPNISQWLEDINDSASAVTTYPDTTSYVDDGADPSLYEDAKHKDGRNEEDNDKQKQERRRERYHPDVQRAVSGQVQNVLKNMWAVSRVNIRDPEEKDGEESKRKEPPPGAVRVQVPGPPPTFVIHGDMGHVVVVDGLEEPIDSRPVEGLNVSAKVVGEWLQDDKRKVRQTQMQENDRKRGDEIGGQEVHAHQSAQKDTQQTWGQLGEMGSRHQDSAYRRQAEELDWSTDSESAIASRPSLLVAEDLGRASSRQLEDVWSGSWEDDGTEVTASNHQAPTVEDVPDSEWSSQW